jgi:hypothetical protein
VSAQRSLGSAAITTLVLLCASWGLQQVAVKLALPTFPPMLQISLRSAGVFAFVLV